MKLHRVAALFLLLAASGCGQKGPLFLPGDPNEGRIVLPTEEELRGEDPAEDGAAEDEAASDSPSTERATDPTPDPAAGDEQ